MSICRYRVVTGNVFLGVPINPVKKGGKQRVKKLSKDSFYIFQRGPEE
jgi:hypothetical protein